MKNITGKKGYPSINDTSCLKCSYNELVSILLKRKGDLQTHLISYRKYVRELADLEVANRCYVARLHELGYGYRAKNPEAIKEIRNVNRLRGYNKQRRIEHIDHIKGTKRIIQHQTSLIRDLHNIIHEIQVRYNGEKYSNYKYNLRLTTYSDGQMKFDAVVCKPVQFVSVDKLNERFEPVEPHVTVMEKVSSASVPSTEKFNVSILVDRP